MNHQPLLDASIHRQHCLAVGPYETSSLALQPANIADVRARLVQAALQHNHAAGIASVPEGCVKVGKSEFLQVWRVHNDALYELLVEDPILWNLGPPGPGQHQHSMKVMPYRPILWTGGFVALENSGQLVQADVLEHPRVAAWHGLFAKPGLEAICSEMRCLGLSDEEDYYNRPVTRRNQLSESPILCFGTGRQRFGVPGSARLKDTPWYLSLVETLSRGRWWAEFLPFYHDYLERSYGAEARWRSEQELVPLLDAHPSAEGRRRQVVVQALMGAISSQGAHVNRPCSYAGELHMAIPLQGDWICGLKHKGAHAVVRVRPGSIVFIGNTLYRNWAMNEMLFPLKKERGLLTLVLRRLTTSETPSLFIPTLSYLGATARQPNTQTFKRPQNQLELLHGHDLASDAAIESLVSHFDYTWLEQEILGRIYKVKGRSRRQSHPMVRVDAEAFVIKNKREDHSGDELKYVTSRARLLDLASDNDAEPGFKASAPFTIYKAVFERPTPQAAYEPMLVICELPHFPQVGLGVYTVKELPAGAFIMPYIGKCRVSEAELTPENTDNVIDCNRRTWWEDALQAQVLDYDVHPYIEFNARPSTAACFSPSFEYINSYRGIAARPNCATDEYGGLYAISSVPQFTELTIEYCARNTQESAFKLPRLANAIPDSYIDSTYEFEQRTGGTS